MRGWCLFGETETGDINLAGVSVIVHNAKCKGYGVVVRVFDDVETCQTLGKVFYSR
jgi:hypothetical protein